MYCSFVKLCWLLVKPIPDSNFHLSLFALGIAVGENAFVMQDFDFAEM